MMLVCDLTVKRTFVKKILVLVPLGAENISSLLSPVLGQYGISVSDFMTQLFPYYQFLNKDLVLRVFVDIFSNNTFSFTVAPLAAAAFLKAHRNQFVSNTLLLYRILVLYSFASRSMFVQKLTYQNIRGYLTSFS
uniref:Ribsomal protein L11 n=1 Tax=Balamuthia mandrillaris TaxID=66527 RepID=A0A0K1HPZ1_9EUKA|nr:ribsomal protein L11 [Balamuthia mandrillaris]